MKDFSREAIMASISMDMRTKPVLVHWVIVIESWYKFNINRALRFNFVKARSVGILWDKRGRVIIPF